MSLAKLPLRLLTVKALTGKTWAGDNVLDSAIAPIDKTVEDQKGILFIVVYTDDARSVPVANSRDLTAATPSVDLVMHIAVATELKTQAGGIDVVIGRSDANFEATLDITEASILAVLSRGTDAWCNLWRSLVTSVSTIRSQRGASAKRGLRYAARELLLTVETPPNPLGTGEDYPWTDIIAAFDVDDDLKPFAAFLGEFVTGAASLQAWQQDYRTFGLSQSVAKALALVTETGEEITFA